VCVKVTKEDLFGWNFGRQRGKCAMNGKNGKWKTSTRSPEVVQCRLFDVLAQLLFTFAPQNAPPIRNMVTVPYYSDMHACDHTCEWLSIISIDDDDDFIP